MVEKDSSTLKSETAMSAGLRILVIEDEKNAQSGLKLFFSLHGIEVLQAFTINEAEGIFNEQHESLDVILVDGCVPGQVLNTLPLIRMMRGRFKGLIVAVSNDEGNRMRMIEAGCSHECDKLVLHKKILGIIDFARRPAA